MPADGAPDQPFSGNQIPIRRQTYQVGRRSFPAKGRRVPLLRRHPLLPRPLLGRGGLLAIRFRVAFGAEGAAETLEEREGLSALCTRFRHQGTLRRDTFATLLLMGSPCHFRRVDRFALKAGQSKGGRDRLSRVF